MIALLLRTLKDNKFHGNIKYSLVHLCLLNTKIPLHDGSCLTIWGAGKVISPSGLPRQSFGRGESGIPFKGGKRKEGVN